MPELDEPAALGLPARLQDIRKSKKLSQDELAAKSAVSRANITAVEQNRRANVRLTTLAQLAEALEVDVLDFFSDRPKESRRPDVTEPLARVIAKVKLLRGEKDLSQEALSLKASRFRTYVGRLENGGANPQVVDLQDLARALGVSIADLLAPIESDDRTRLPIAS